ncbi:protein Skeletor, isoforms D/E-like [Amphibalanus amphitrite]|uniref:protein Skeletor, isoforms D/E-like n=1 Tax=Amphibalanus amphitrite TaxID=1232801 RepID=UPI001C9288D7|nr:protein Skeletor, isoforms D/E-like [Amphibalanus amphitrite]
MVPTRGVLLLALAAACIGLASSQKYYGKELGSFKTLEHGVRGTVYAVDSRTLYIRNFNYDGQGPDAFFYVGSGNRPSNSGYKVPDENGRTEPLKAYRNKDITLTLPNGVTMDKVQWVSVWCKAYSVDFGNIILPRPVTDYPRPQKLGRMVTREHGVASADVVAVDAQTLLVPDFTYDGEGPDAHFWAGTGNPSNTGFIVPDENGSQQPLKSYKRKTVVLTLPGDKTVFDIDYLSIWCRQYSADFGHLSIDRRGLNVPPSLKMLGVQPQTKLNCEVLDEELAFEVRWAIAGQSMVMQLVSKIEDGQYMAFGLSGHPTRSVMIGADAVVTWLDRRSGQGVAEDYFLQAKRQCSAGKGACPDTQLQGGKSGVRLLNSAFINGFSMLTFQRPLNSSDRWDTAVVPDQRQAVVWAVGPVSAAGDVGYHRRRVRGDLQLHFGRAPAWNCPVTPAESTDRPPESAAEPPPAPAWHVPPIPCHEPDDRVYYVQLGPTGGPRGYSAITGRVGWGVAWYVNGLLVPEINVVRGRTYTFVVEGGGDPERPAKYHPFYITDDPEGGYQFKTPQERARVRVLAGVETDASGVARPTATGRLCQWRVDSRRRPPAAGYSSFGAYQRTLQLDCEEGQPGILQWTPDGDTPDTVYYQCFTHRFLGWKINVLDSCPTGSAVPASQLNQIKRVMKGAYNDYDYYEDEVAQSSVRVEQTIPNSIQPQQQPAFIDFSEGSDFDWPSEPPPAAGRPRPQRPQDRPNHGFQFDDFPPGFPRPDLPPPSDHMPIPRPDFDFGARLRPRRPEPEVTREPERFPPPQSVVDLPATYLAKERPISSDRGQPQPAGGGVVYRQPQPPTVPPRRTQLNRVHRPPVNDVSDYSPTPPPPTRRPSTRPVHSNGRKPFPRPAPAKETTERTEVTIEPAEVAPSLPPPPPTFRPTSSSRLPAASRPTYNRPGRPAVTTPPPSPPPTAPPSTAPPSPPSRPSTEPSSRPPWTATSRRPPPQRQVSYQPLAREAVPPPVSPAPRVPAVVFGRPPGVSAQAVRPFAQQVTTSPPRPSVPGHGFDPSDVVFEGGFIPVKHSDRNNPPLAFEVADVAGGGVVKSPAPAAVAQGGNSRFQPSAQDSRFSGPLLATSPDRRRPQAVSIPLPESLVPVGPSIAPTADTRVETPPPREPARPPSNQQGLIQVDSRPAEPEFRPEQPQSRPEQSRFRPEEPQFRPEGPQFRPEEPQFRPEEPQFRPEEPQFRPEEPQFRPEENSFRPEEIQFVPGEPAPPAGSFRPPLPPGVDQRPPFQFGPTGVPGGGDDQRVRPPPRRRPQRPSGGFLDGLLSYLPGLGGGRPARRRQQPPPPPRFGNPNRRLELGGPGRHSGRPLRPPHRLPTEPRMQAVFESAPFRPSPVDPSDDEPHHRQNEPVQDFIRVSPQQGTPLRYQQALRERIVSTGYTGGSDRGTPERRYSDPRDSRPEYSSRFDQDESRGSRGQETMLSKRSGLVSGQEMTPLPQRSERPPTRPQADTDQTRETPEQVPAAFAPPQTFTQGAQISVTSDHEPPRIPAPGPDISVASNRGSSQMFVSEPESTVTSNRRHYPTSAPKPDTTVSSDVDPSPAPTPSSDTRAPSDPVSSQTPVPEPNPMVTPSQSLLSSSTSASPAGPASAPAPTKRPQLAPASEKKYRPPMRTKTDSESIPHNILEDIWSRMREAGGSQKTV